MLNTAVCGAPDLISAADDPLALRDTFSLFPSGVAAIAAEVEGGLSVLVASSFQVGISLDPPLVLFAAQSTSRSWSNLRSRSHLGVSVLGEAHDKAAMQLASKARDRFAGIDITTVPSGATFIHGAPVWLDCSIHSIIPAGDHDVVIMEVHAMGNVKDTEPLIWHRSKFRSMTPTGVEG